MTRNEAITFFEHLIPGNGISEEATRMAIEALKEKQCVKPFHRCNGSEYTLIEDSHFDFCPYCGKPIDWEDGDRE